MTKIKQYIYIHLKNPICYIILSIIYLELLIRMDIYQNITFSFFYIILSSISVGFFFGVIAQLFKEKVNKIVLALFLFFMSLYYTSQILYHDFFKAFLTFYSIGNGGQVAEFYKDILQLIFNNTFWIILCFLPFVFYICYMNKKMNKQQLPIKKAIQLGSITIGLFIISYFSLYIPTSHTIKTIDIYKEYMIDDQSVDKLGLLTSCRLDLHSLIFGRNQDTENNSTEKEVIIEEKTYEPQIMNISFDDLINNTNNKTLKNMHTYFKNVTPTYKNEYTGMFKDYNLILMTCEGFSPYAIDKELTPTLYKLSHEGFVFNNFYTPLWTVSTSDGEYVALQSLIPKNGTWSFKDSAKNDLPFTMGQQLKKLGYTTKAYHDHSYKYYGRNLSHPNIGYEYKGLGNGLNIKKQWPESDLEMMEQTIGEYIHEDKFHTYYMTVSGHTNYTYQGNMMARKNKKYVDHLEYSNLAKGYLATQIELDRAMEKLLQELKEAGKDQNTLIVMSADHYPYGLPYENYSELAGHKIEKNFELYKNNLIIWSASMKEPIVVDKLGCSMDILPTISNLMGIEYDSRLLMGTDLLSDSESLVIFSNKSFMTEKVQYNAITDQATWLNGAKEDSDYLKQMIQIVKEKIKYSEQILDQNYYHYVFKKEEE